MEFDKLSNRVICYAIEVHRELGPGLMESTYENCLVHELRMHEIFCESQKSLPVNYKGMDLECGYRIDLLVENSLIVELKSVDMILKIHQAQLLTYMKLANIRTGLLINFNTRLLKDNIKRMVL